MTSQDNLCAYPWNNLTIDPDGKVRPCCKYESYYADPSGKYLNINQQSLGQIWDSTAIENLKKSFLAGKKLKECSRCWDEEKIGMRSMRQEAFLHRPNAEYSTLKSSAPKSLDIKLNNLCNLKCRICGPWLSTKWIAEAQDTGKWNVDEFIKISKSSFLDNSSNKASLESWAGDLELVEIFGGEPLINEDFYQVLEILTQKENSKNISVILNSNGTIFSDKLVEYSKKLKKVTLNLSIDDLFERFEYQRHGAKWKNVVANIEKYNQLKSAQLQPIIYITVGILNIFYLKDIFNFFRNQFPELWVYINLVHYPSYYSVINLPEHLKETIKHNLEEYRKAVLPHTDKDIQNVVNFMFSKKQDSKSWEKFLSFNDSCDSYRKESFSETFPAFFAEIGM